jgi:hypothetical protein
MVNQLVEDESLQRRAILAASVGVSLQTSDGTLAGIESSNVGHATVVYRENLPAIYRCVGRPPRRASTTGLHSRSYQSTCGHRARSSHSRESEHPWPDHVGTTRGPRRDCDNQQHCHPGSPSERSGPAAGGTRRTPPTRGRHEPVLRSHRWSISTMPTVLRSVDADTRSRGWGPAVVSLIGLRRNGHGKDGIGSHSIEGCRFGAS